MIRPARRRSWPLMTAALVLLVGAGVVLWSGSTREVRQEPSSPTLARTLRRPSLQDSVGVLFRAGAGGALAQACTAVVVDSTTHDVVATAAHCLIDGGTLVFAPGYRDDRAPHGYWTVTSSHTDGTWQDHGDEDDDYALLTVRARTGDAAGPPVQLVVGGLPMGVTPRSGQQVVVRGYPIALRGRALTCRTAVRVTREFPTVDCAAFSAGTSGGPLVTGADNVPTLVGVIGGLEEGGCTDDVSYASPFTAAARTVLLAAERHEASSRIPRTLSTTPC